MDAEQIRRDMRRTRASIDRKLDALTVRAEAAKQRAMKQGAVMVSISVALMMIRRWWRRRAALKRERARFGSAVAADLEARRLALPRYP